jgi:hypothetical protein
VSATRGNKWGAEAQGFSRRKAEATRKGAERLNERPRRRAERLDSKRAEAKEEGGPRFRMMRWPRG